MDIQSLGIENLSRSIEVDGDVRKSGVSNQQEQKSSSTTGSGTTFSELLTKMVEETNQQQVEADHAVKELVAGRNKNIHETMLTLERADTSLKMMMQVRNKVLDAYREIMRMQV